MGSAGVAPDSTMASEARSRSSSAGKVLCRMCRAPSLERISSACSPYARPARAIRMASLRFSAVGCLFGAIASTLDRSCGSRRYRPRAGVVGHPGPVRSSTIWQQDHGEPGHDGSDQKEESMSRLLVRNFSVSLDGYAAGPDQDLDHPLGVGGTQLHEWIFATRSGRQMIGNDGGNKGLDDEYFSKRGSGVGATIMGRNMFGPIRGPWNESEWTGWWGEDPPFRHPVFVLTRHPHAPIEMQGGTTFH